MKKTLSSMLMAGWAAGFLAGCSPYSQTDDLSQNSLANLVCTTPSCITPSTDNLSIRVNLNGGTQFALLPGVGDFNLGGDCNEGGFAYNTITWELYQTDLNAKVRDSTGMGATSRCVNGRFSIYILLTSATVDSVNRTGLLSATGQRVPYTVRVTIFGQNAVGGPPQVGSNSVYSISLLPQ